MSWSINYIGFPENIANELQKTSETLTGASKIEFDNVLPHFLGIIRQNYNGDSFPTLQIIASGHGYDKHNQCMVEIKHFSNTPLTYGEKWVELTFNSSGDSNVNDIKTAAAHLIDMINRARKQDKVKNSNQENTEMSDYRYALYNRAIETALDAQMQAVKAITWKY